MPDISAAEARAIARDRFGLDATAEKLPGEYDDNFALTDASGERHLLRVSRAGEPTAALDFQSAILAHLAARAPQLPVQCERRSTAGTLVEMWNDADGNARGLRLLSYLPGRVLAEVRPHTPELLRDIGRLLGEVDIALADFAHPFAERELKWDLARADWIGAHTQLIRDGSRRALVERYLAHFVNAVQPHLAALHKQVTHNDANDYNILVEGRGYDARVSGLIDFGDAIATPRACNLAIAAAYAMLGKRDPVAAASRVVAGYHAASPLTSDEIELLFPLAVMRLCVSVVNSALRAQERPDDKYVTISEAPAWTALELLEAVHPRLATYKFRAGCDLEPVPHSREIAAWLRDNADSFASVVRPDLRTARVNVLDLSVGSLALGLADETDTTEKFTRKIFAELAEAGAAFGIGRYDEARLIYANDDFATSGENGPEFRTIHIALDVFGPAGEPVFAPLDGVVHSFRDNTARLDYGPCIILEHAIQRERDTLTFYTLYGHLSRESLEKLRVGRRVAKGEQFATFGDFPINGDWPPHVHFQVIADLLDFDGTFPGVARPSDRAVWLSLCPDPNLICGVPCENFPASQLRGDEIRAKRRELVGTNLSLSYRQPLTLVRGQGQFLYDEDGRRFLDLYNNVQHVGHCHPHVVRAAQAQMAVFNANTRYLHENLVRYAERLTATLPSSLRVCFFVNSGSEATELAIRLARARTGHRDLIVSRGAYHGHTNTLIDVSPYKANGPGGKGLPDWVHEAPLPDVYRGPFRADDPRAGEKYARELAPIVERIHGEGRGLCGFLIESIPSVGGQIVLPDGYLRESYRIVRAAGGVCMADEVQTGFGRIGTHFWAFEPHGVVPDIVAMGKPIGNGHPLGAVVTTPEIAAAFDNGMEFFATFGGNPVSCAVGMAVLDVVEREGLQQHARELGDHAMAKLRELQREFEIVGDVRGAGLFLGVELTRDRNTREPAARQAAYVVNRLCERGVLIGTDGLDHNVLKIRGPMVVTRDDVDGLVTQLRTVLAEDAAQPDA